MRRRPEDADHRKRGLRGKLPPIDNTVDVTSATWTNTKGDPELGAVWTDPDLDPALRAFCYARVTEIATPRWRCYDAVRLGIEMSPQLPMIHQEWAWTSPMWYALTW